MLAIVEFSGAPHSVRQGTLSALKARGRWPSEDGPATGVICISLIGMMLHGVCCRSTARWRVRRACKLGYWRELREANHWGNCPKCGTRRDIGTCDHCGYVGRAKNPDGTANFEEFSRPYMYEIDIEKFRSAPRCRELRHYEARTYAEFKELPRRGENVTEFPRKPAQPAQPPHDPAPAAPLPKRDQPAAEHRGTERSPAPKMTKRECARFIAQMAQAMRGFTSFVGVDHLEVRLDPSDPRYRPKLNWREALDLIAKNWQRTSDSVIEALKFWGYTVEPEPGA